MRSILVFILLSLTSCGGGFSRESCEKLCASSGHTVCSYEDGPNAVCLCGDCSEEKK